MADTDQMTADHPSPAEPGSELADESPPGCGPALVRCAARQVLAGLAEDRRQLAAGARFEELANLPCWLPPAYAQHYTPELLAEFAACVERVSDLLAASEPPELGSTGEELAAHAILGEALRHSDSDPAELAELGISSRGEALEALELIAERAFEDGGMLILFDPEMRRS